MADSNRTVGRTDEEIDDTAFWMDIRNDIFEMLDKFGLELDEDSPSGGLHGDLKDGYELHMEVKAKSKKLRQNMAVLAPS